MTHDQIWRRIAREVEELLAAGSRANLAKERTYWYPLSVASYAHDEILEALDSMCAFRTSMWEKTRKFERAFAEWNDSSQAVMVNSGSSADLLLSYLLADPSNRLAPVGTEALVPAVTWPTQVWSLLMAGFKVTFVDVEPSTLNISLDDLESKVTPRSSVLSLVHLMGNPCDMDAVRKVAEKHNLNVIEDCCEALGAKWRGIPVGNFGLGGAFSFFFSHHITTMEGGMVSVRDEAAADRLRVLRAHGWTRNVASPPADVAATGIDARYAFIGWGFNVRPTEVQAAFGIHQLAKLPAFNARRARLAARFFDFVDQSAVLARPTVADGAEPSWMALPMMVDAAAPFSRNDLTAYLESQGVETRPVVAGNLLRQPAMRLFPELSKGALPGADAIHDRGLYVGLSPMTSDADFDRLLETFDAFLRRF